ncbi:hypothetical protein MBLNU230_g1838t1 [Neophaeotheca triangularis]
MRKNIRDYFRPSIPKNRVPIQDIDDDIAVAPRPRGTSKEESIPVDSPSPTPTPKHKTSVSESLLGGTPTPTKRRPGLSRKQTSQSGRDAVYDAPPHHAATPKHGARLRNIPQYDGAGDDIFSSSLSSAPSSVASPTLPTKTLPHIRSQPNSVSQQPMMAPLERQAKDETPVEPPKEAKPASTSFGSFSTLSSVPISSQSSSKRVVKNGIKGVTNSDSGSQESSEDELADVDTFISNKRRKITPSPPASHEKGTSTTAVGDTVGTRETRSARTSDVKRRRTYSPQLPPKPVYRHSLLNMVKQNDKEKKANEAIAKAEVSVQQAGKWREEEAMKVDEDESMSMAVAMADDSDAGERMRNAMARTEALRGDEFFYFFKDTEPVTPRSPFPLHTLPEQGWMSMLQDEQSREDAVMSGVIAEASASQPLPQLIVDWMTCELAYEQREELCEAYVDIIRACTISHGFETAALSSFDAFYDTLPLSAKGDAAEKQTHKWTRLLPHGVRYMVQAVRYCVEGRDQDSTAETLFTFALLNVDQNVRHDVDLQLVLHNNMDALLEAVSGSVLSAVYAAVRDKIFGCEQITDLVRLRLINAMPATSTRLYELRRTLALRCFDSDVIASPETAVSSALLTTLLTHVRTSPAWSIADATDYTILHAKTDVLSLAVPAGFAPSNPPLALPTPTSPKHLDPADKPSLFADSTSAGSALSRKEKEFNDRLDALVSQLRSISSRIKDAGTSHLKRTEAKAAIERVIVVLEVSVRSKPKRRKGVFDDARPEGGMIEAFLGPAGLQE